MLASVTPGTACSTSQAIARSLVADAARIRSCSRASFTERASSTARDPSTNELAAPADMSGTSQRAARSLSTPSGAS